MADGHAATAPGTLNDLAAFIADNHDALVDPREDEAPSRESASPRTRAKADADTPEEKEDDAALAPDPEDEPEPDDDAHPSKEAKEEDEEEPEDAKDQTRERKHKVTIKGEDGADATVEVTDSELVKGYMRQADYSRKRASDEAQKTEMAQRTLGALETQRTRHVEQLETYSRAVQRLAGLRSPQDMAILAQNDPATWVAEQQRERLISAEITRMQADIQAEKAEAERIQQVTQEKAFAQAWGVLGHHGIDKPKLRKIFDDTTKHFGIEEARFGAISDPKLVLILQAATKYMELKSKTAEVTQKAKDAPRLPAQRQPVPRNERAARAIDARFKGGKAKLEDLAAYIQINKL